MKKIVFALLLAFPLLNSCQKEEKLEEKLEGHSGEMEDGYGLSEKELTQISDLKKEIILEIKKGDSITVAGLRTEIDSLKAEIHKLKGKK
ncbi:hypothetical protein [Cytophaga hutchinsonii]|jgi:hypothetical protein|uniref:Uncharacterized protein n=1 Tax=Cytophaga hutchinsonii (strain ATCC 33406 / DSM 1761 / CIP 103989 / NBRC 15051 / NCIMB 9469 / D465) TaxID=269798 RepID=A0A6N4SVU9_CYTH3|nr:hypothetical protein [Cytophaga hutchinsonii]ABG60664.1 hypothetical protein CHU_3428 [Cytophaga hutchinsonii ATCC 33406]SFY01529.1 hypothetical protein SAMN04487930_11936 [Cytophaga hutchinsonii ATCC 33406]